MMLTCDGLERPSLRLGSVGNRFARIFLVGLAVLGVVACDAPLFGGSPPSDSVTVDVDLAPGESETYLFDIEAEALEVRELVFVVMDPIQHSLEPRGIRVQKSWSRDGVEEDGWPERPEFVEVSPGAPLRGLLDLTLTNEGESTVEMQVTITILNKGALPPATEETLRVAIDRR